MGRYGRWRPRQRPYRLSSLVLAAGNGLSNVEVNLFSLSSHRLMSASPTSRSSFFVFRPIPSALAGPACFWARPEDGRRLANQLLRAESQHQPGPVLRRSVVVAAAAFPQPGGLALTRAQRNTQHSTTATTTSSDEAKKGSSSSSSGCCSSSLLPCLPREAAPVLPARLSPPAGQGDRLDEAANAERTGSLLDERACRRPSAFPLFLLLRRAAGQKRGRSRKRAGASGRESQLDGQVGQERRPQCATWQAEPQETNQRSQTGGCTALCTTLHSLLCSAVQTRQVQ